MDILEEYYTERFNNDPKFSELSEDQIKILKNSLNFAIYNLVIARNNLINSKMKIFREKDNYEELPKLTFLESKLSNYIIYCLFIFTITLGLWLSYFKY